MTHVGSAGPPGNAQKGGWQVPFPILKAQPTGRSRPIVLRFRLIETA